MGRNPKTGSFRVASHESVGRNANQAHSDTASHSRVGRNAKHAHYGIASHKPVGRNMIAARFDVAFHKPPANQWDATRLRLFLALHPTTYRKHSSHHGHHGPPAQGFLGICPEFEILLRKRAGQRKVFSGAGHVSRFSCAYGSDSARFSRTEGFPRDSLAQMGCTNGRTNGNAKQTNHTGRTSLSYPTHEKPPAKTPRPNHTHTNWRRLIFCRNCVQRARNPDWTRGFVIHQCDPSH